MANVPWLVIATQNAGKAREFRDLLGHGPWLLRDLSDFPGIVVGEEGTSSLADNARRKASEAAAQLGHFVLADDTALEVDALHGAPGIHTARYAGPNATPDANRRRLLERLRDVPLDERTARFVCRLALADPAGRICTEATGQCRGRIRCHEIGSGGFGYDALFELIEYRRTLAEIGPAAAACLTHRARAARAVWPELLQRLRPMR
jgi:XTP/dITP diphosphohydrolase